MGKKNSLNNSVEKGSRSRIISEEDLIPLVEKELVEWDFDTVEPHYFFKGAVLCFVLCLPFWIMLFNLIT